MKAGAAPRAPAPTLPDLLRQPPAALRALQDRLLREMVELCYRAHPFCRRLMKREGLEPRHLQTCDDLVRLPISTKADFLAEPEAFRLRADDLPAGEATLWKVIYTTGTTSGRPAPIYVTSFDFYQYLFITGRQQDLVGLRATDVIANLFPLTPFPMGAYGRAFDEAAAAGAAMVCSHTGRDASVFPVHRSLDEAVRVVERHRATVLWGVAGFVRRVLVRAAELGADFRAVRLAMITGEASSRAMRDDLRRRMRELGCTGDTLVNRYGSTEQGASMVECREGAGFHSLAPDTVFHEVVDDHTGERLPEGETGVLLFTHLLRRGTAFLRYRIGDMASMSTEPCAHCGRTTPRITSQPVRSGDIVKIKGTLVNLQALKDLLERMPEIDEYQIIIQPQDAADPFSQDELVLRIAAAGALASPDALAEEVTRLAHVRPRIEPAGRDQIFDPVRTTKPQRVLDRRPPKA
jgi:phenylacetate-coenzyme A ligase PaaK-like adenylate-forming protein